jgi:hypothetical protein
VCGCRAWNSAACSINSAVICSSTFGGRSEGCRRVRRHSAGRRPAAQGSSQPTRRASRSSAHATFEASVSTSTRYGRSASGESISPRESPTDLALGAVSQPAVQPDSQTARQPDSQTARQPDSLRAASCCWTAPSGVWLIADAVVAGSGWFDNGRRYLIAGHSFIEDVAPHELSVRQSAHHWPAQSSRTATARISQPGSTEAGDHGTLFADPLGSPCVRIDGGPLHGSVAGDSRRITEYGAPRTDNVTNPIRYGWLGSKQRSADALAGVILMGVCLYNPLIFASSLWIPSTAQ